MIFDFYIGGYGCESYHLILKDSQLHCSDYIGLPEGHDKIVSVEEKDDWKKLRGFLESCNWKKKYDSNMLDGT